MDRYRRLYKNWRVYVLMAVFSLAALLMLGENNSTEVTVIAKCTGIALAWIFRSLVIYWQGRGEIDDLMELAREED